MSDSLWMDITTEDADALADFYVNVMGWKKEAFDMGGYNDYVMMKEDGSPAGGICHKRGCNSNIPGGWVPYFTVADLDAALAASKSTGGEQIGDIRHHGTSRFCIIKDPSGACCALYEQGAD